MPTLASPGWFEYLSSGSNGNDRAHALIYANNYIWVGCQTDPGHVCRINPASPSSIDTIVFPNDGAHKGVMDMVYIPAKNKVYALMGDMFADTGYATVVEIDTTTLAYTNVILDASYNVQQGSFTFDANYMFILSRSTSDLYVYRLSDWVKVYHGPSGVTFGHCIRYDSVTNKVFTTSSGSWGGFSLIARINPATFAIEQNGFWEADKVVSDDIAFVGNYVYCAMESTGNILKFQKDNLTNVTRINTGIVGRAFGCYWDGGVVWTGWEGNAGLFAKIDPATDALTIYQMPQAFSLSPTFPGNCNEWVRSTTNLYMTGWAFPSWLTQITVTNFDPPGGSLPASVTLSFSDIITFTDQTPEGEDTVHPGISVSDFLRLSDLFGSSRVQANPVADALELGDRVDLGNNRGIGITDILTLVDGFNPLGQIRVSDSLNLQDFCEAFEDIPGLVPLTVLISDRLEFYDLRSIVFRNGEILITDALFFQDSRGANLNSRRDDYLRRYLNDMIRF
jgi:hypothetical protein